MAVGSRGWLPDEPAVHFTIREPKGRVVAAAPFRDRVVHHAIVRVIEPVLERRFIEDSYACRREKGAHAAMRRAAEFARRWPYALKCDVRKYSPSIDHEVSLALLRRVIGDERLMELIQHILASHEDGQRQVWTPDGDLSAKESRMKLEYLADGAPECPVIRLYDIAAVEAAQLAAAVGGWASGSVDRVETHRLPFGEPIGGCQLTLVRRPWDQAVVQVGISAFECGFTAGTWGNVAGLVEPFAKDADGFQWLAGSPGEAVVLLSASGGW